MTRPSTHGRRIVAAALGAFAICLYGAAVAQDYPRAVNELVASAKAQVRTIDLAAFKSALDRKDAGLVIDVREPPEYAGGHVPGAINIPRGVIELRIWPHVGYPGNTDMNRKMTLYCGSGVRCILAAKSLQDLGFTSVTAVDMKIGDWAKAGYPLVTE
jgi:rhodanese-related sulfurtransferase